MPQIGKVARDAVRTLMADPTNGFNPTYASLISTYNSPVTTISFTATSSNFAQGQLTPDQVDENGDYNYPMVVLYKTRTVNTNKAKYAIFSGDIEIAIDFWLSWANAEVVPDTQSWSDAIEDAMWTIFNGRFGTQSFEGAGLKYNGELSLTPEPLRVAGENWLQVLGFRAQFGL